MGAYLSKPVTDKDIESGDNEFLSYTSCSMQGWRTSQEDAHNCILNLNEDFSLFAVYDGHGGAEVAQLCSQKFPNHIKNSSDFINGNYSDALTKSFLSFDDEILTAEMQEELKKLANIDDMKSDVEEEEDDALLLQEEAMVPLSEILKKYQLPSKSYSDDEIGDDEEKVMENQEENECKKITGNKSSYFDQPDITKAEDKLRKVQEVADEVSEDEDDEEFVIEDENDEGDDDDDEEDDDEEEDEDEDGGDDDGEGENDETNSCFPPFQYLRSAPGYDSGTTAVLSLINRKALKVYVANVGDSRCVLCRNSEAIDLSIDHKPEDEIESQRIKKAGGSLTEDGRVNGGLNLSRSLGDHSYKKNKDLEMKDQMISAFPDIQVIDLKPHEDEFLILACDGIWNTFSSQQLVDFVKKRISTMSMPNLIAEIFSHCLAPNTSGDGTGCDNMTCIIVTFKFPVSICNGNSSSNVSLSSSVSASVCSVSAASSNKKRPAPINNDLFDETVPSAAKINKTAIAGQQENVDRDDASFADRNFII